MDKLNEHLDFDLEETIKKELEEEFQFDIREAETYFKENLEEFDFDLEDPYGDSFSD